MPRITLTIYDAAWNKMEDEADKRTWGAIGAIDVVIDSIEAKFGLGTTKFSVQENPEANPGLKTGFVAQHDIDANASLRAEDYVSLAPVEDDPDYLCSNLSKRVLVLVEKPKQLLFGRYLFSTKK